MGRYSMTEPRVMIVTPVLDDWEAFQRLIAELAHIGGGMRFDLLVVDDGSNSPFEIRQLTLPPDGAIRAVTMIRLALNLGHQRAIAVGLTEAALRDDIDAVVVMDSDGEDRPEDVPALLDAHRAAPDAVIFAQRARRSESMLFKAGVFAYRILFRVLARQSVELIERYYRQFETAGDRAGQHHALMMAMTMFDRARWTRKPREAEIFRQWLQARLTEARLFEETEGLRDRGRRKDREKSE